MPTKPEVLPERLKDALTLLRIARDRHQAAKVEYSNRLDRAMEWMREKPTTRTTGEAWAYVGIDSAEDEKKAAHRAVHEAVDRLLGLLGSVGAVVGA